MPKFAPIEVNDAPLDVVALATRQIACSAQPTTYAEALSYALADASFSSGDFTKAAGSVSGRRLTMAAKSGVLIDASGTATHVALVSDDDSKLRYVTTCAPLPLTANGTNTCSMPSWGIEQRAPS